MLRIIIPIILIASAGGIFYFLTDPIINAPRALDPATQAVTGGIKALRTEKADLEKAIADIQSLKGRAQELEATYQTIGNDNIERLDVFLPDSVDDLQLIVDVNTIAEKSGMQVKDVKVSTDADKNSRASATRVVATSSPLTAKPTVSTMNLSFAVTGTYSQLRAFLTDLTRSLRVLDISRLSFTTQTPSATSSTSVVGGQYQYQVELSTYWLK